MYPPNSGWTHHDRISTSRRTHVEIGVEVEVEVELRARLTLGWSRVGVELGLSRSRVGVEPESSWKVGVGS